MGGNLRFETFKGLVSLSMEDLCRELFLDNRESIKIKKEGGGGQEPREDTRCRPDLEQ
jgi:hypothetical protein